MHLTLSSVSRTALDPVVTRASQFLRTVGTDGTVRAAMASVGFKDADLREGYALLLGAMAPSHSPATAQIPVAEAIARLERWQAVAFPVARAALQRLHPAQAAFVFEGVVPGSGATAVIAARLVLGRLADLENAQDRKASRKADHAALATLDERGITASERAEMLQRAAFVESHSVAAPAAPTPDRAAPVLALRAWVLDWSECARVVIKRRDLLIRMGIGKRRARAAKTPAGASASPASPAAPALPAPTGALHETAIAS